MTFPFVPNPSGNSDLGAIIFVGGGGIMFVLAAVITAIGAIIVAFINRKKS
jgi:hypothetical protein